MEVKYRCAGCGKSRGLEEFIRNATKCDHKDSRAILNYHWVFFCDACHEAGIPVEHPAYSH
jgi:hypothetical protein